MMRTTLHSIGAARWPWTGAVLVCLFVFLAGCDSGESASQVPESPGEAEEQLTAAFEEINDPSVQTKIQTFSQALEANNYAAAYQGLHDLGQAQATSLNQVVAVENADRLLQRRILEGVERGEPAAIQAWELIKAGRRR